MSMHVDTSNDSTELLPTFSISVDASSLEMYSANQVAGFGLLGPWADRLGWANSKSPTGSAYVAQCPFRLRREHFLESSVLDPRKRLTVAPELRQEF